MSKKENDYQAALIKTLYLLFPDCYIIKNDPQYQQGILDLTILYKDRWAMLEVKASRRARHRPNQDYFVDLFSSMSFAAFIYPENEEEVLYELQQAFASRRRPRVSKS